MNIYKLILKIKYKIGNQKKVYISRIAGDTNSFRYPHLDQYKHNFNYDKQNEVFILNKNIEETINYFGINDITVYELINSYAKKLHLYDFLGYKANYKEKYYAYKSVCQDYNANAKNKSWPYPISMKKIDISKIKIRDEFKSLEQFINKTKNNNILMCQFQNTPSIFQFGSTLKGTNIVFTDNYDSNFGQELFHIIFHLEEGIKGFKNDNLNIIEKWSSVPWLYLLQLLNGRLTRRIRQNKSPHDIKFLDYVFLRAYIGSSFIDKNKDPYYHSIYSLIEPSIKLLISSFKDKTIYQTNDVLIKAICNDKTENIKNDFNKKYGASSFEGFYNNFNLFDRLNNIKKICIANKIEEETIYKVMFNNNNLIKTVIDYKLVAFIWLSEKINKDKSIIIDLIEDYSNVMIKEKKNIHIEDWLEHIKKTFGNHKYQSTLLEYQKYKDILRRL